MIKQHLCPQIAVFVKDVDTGEVILSHNQSTPFPSASVIKLFVLGYFADKQDEVLTVTSKDRVGTSIVSELKLKNLTVKEALMYMTAFSDNTATNLLIKHAGMEEINGYIRSLGCTGTVLRRKMMDFAARERGEENQTTLEDCFKIMSLLIENPVAVACLEQGKSKERLERYIFGGARVLSKGGDLNDVFNDVGVVYTADGKRVFAGVLTYKYDKSLAKRLCGKTGLLACGKETPAVKVF